MPSYCYICDDCGNKFEEMRAVGDHARRCPECDSTKVGRDYKTEFSGIGVEADDWTDGGYNYGISEYFTSKTDLMNKIRAKGFEPMLHSAGLKKVKRELYGDERRMIKNKPPVETVDIED